MNPMEREEPVVSALPELPPGVTLRALSARVTDGITIQDASGRVVYANEAAAPDAGYESAADLVRDPSAWLERFELLDRSEAPITLEDLPGRRVLSGERPGPLLVKAVHRATGAAPRAQVRGGALFGPGRPVADGVHHQPARHPRHPPRGW